jgi:phosphoglycolate phosphatase-like HAD superfamily hydrolase
MQVVIFDVEGTLVDCATQTIEAWRETLLGFGFDVTAQTLQQQNGRDGDEMLQRIVPDAGEDLRKQMAKRQGELYREKFLPTVRAFPQVRELFEHLKGNGYRIGLGTTCQPEELKVYENLMNVRDLTDTVACGADVKHGKPHPDLFRLALHNLNASPSDQATAIGDTPYDGRAAQAAGIAAVGLEGGGFSADALRQAGCAAVFRDVADLLDRRAEWPASMPDLTVSALAAQ